ncbi:hypothetical protein V6Z12_A03G127600 [Gossypium hirsutum]
MRGHYDILEIKSNCIVENQNVLALSSLKNQRKFYAFVSQEVYIEIGLFFHYMQKVSQEFY